jgi:hypothetical protein
VDHGTGRDEPGSLPEYTLGKPSYIDGPGSKYCSAGVWKMLLGHTSDVAQGWTSQFLEN